MDKTSITGLDQTIVNPFKNTIQGKVIQPGEEGYETERKVWNGMIDKYPSLIVQCANDQDVLKAVNFARAQNLLVAVRGGGHNVAGFSTVDGGIIIDLSLMKGITVDPVNQTATAQAGLTWGEFDKATQQFGLAVTGGLVSSTGIAGFSLGGGIGWLMRKYGLTVDNLLALDVVTADGKQVKTSAVENPDLFWGMRGGGGNFGIVTAFKFRLYPLGPTVLGGPIFYPLEKAGEILRFYRRWAPTLPDELTTMAVFLTAPPEPFVPQPLQGAKMIAVALCYTGEVSKGEALVAPLRQFASPAIDLVGPLPYLALQGMFDGGAPKGFQNYWKTEYLSDLTDLAIDTIVRHAGQMPSPFDAVHIHHVEGAVNRTNKDETAFAYRDARYILNILGVWPDAADNQANISWVRGLWQAVQPLATGAVYLNFMGEESHDRVVAAYGEQKYERLVELKKKYDPTNFFRLNQNIQPNGSKGHE